MNYRIFCVLIFVFIVIFFDVSRLCQAQNFRYEKAFHWEDLNENEADEIMDLLLKYSENDLGLPPIHYAVFIKEIKVVKKILPHTYPNQSTKSKGTALDIAMTNKDLEMCELLLKYGCVATKCGPHNKIANELVYADGAASSKEILELLIIYQQIIPDGQFLERILWNPYCTYEVVKFLIDLGIDCTYHEFPERGCLYPAVGKRDVRILQLILENGGRQFVNEGCRWWDNPLANAIMWNRPQSVRILLDNGAMLSLDKDDFEYVFGTTIHKGLFECFKQIPQFVENINKVCEPYYLQQKNVERITILQKAIILGDIDFVVWLISSMVDINYSGGIGKSPLQLAIELKNNKIANLLIQKGAKL
jgi:hypothetical protein